MGHSDSLCNQVDVVDYTGSLASAADCAAAILADPSICPSGAFVMPENPAYFCRCCSSSAPQNDSPDWHIYQVMDISSETTSAPTFLRPPMDDESHETSSPIVTPAPTDAEAEEGPAERLDDDASSAHTTVLFTATTAV